MIVASLLLVIAAAVTLLLGLLDRQNIQWVWASIGCCLLAGLLLTIGVLRSRPSRKPVLQSGGEGAAASWAGASTWGGNAGQSSSAVLTRDEDDADGTVVITDQPELKGDDEPTRTDLPAPAPAQDEPTSSPWAPSASDEDTGEVRLVPAEPSAPIDSEPEPAPVDDDVIVVPKPSARGGGSAEDAVAGPTAAAAPDPFPSVDADPGTAQVATAEARRLEPVLP